jgi:hypothetical protein
MALHRAQPVAKPFEIFRVRLRELLDQVEENLFPRIPSEKARQTRSRIQADLAFATVVGHPRRRQADRIQCGRGPGRY